jgi:uncharacterized membrane protein YhiD involved in acid resistance
MEMRNSKDPKRDEAPDEKALRRESPERTPGFPLRIINQTASPSKGRIAKFLNHPLVVLGALMLCLLLILLLTNRLSWLEEPSKSVNPPAKSVNPPTVQTAGNPPAIEGQTSAQPVASEPSFLSRLFDLGAESPEGGKNWVKQVSTLLFRLILAALLAAVLAFRPHRLFPAMQRNPFVAQTQILLAVVAAALMMIVSDNAARAFGIFAAASLVRFRTSIHDPKEITVLLISLGIGLAAGVGRWELAIIFSLFVLILLRILERQETYEVFRAMELKIKTHRVEETDKALRQLFASHHLNVEILELNREDKKNPLGKIVYNLSVRSDLSVDRIGEEIFSSDPNNIDSVEWHQKKTSSYLYR